jgi:ribosomal protein S13
LYMARVSHSNNIVYELSTKMKGIALSTVLKSVTRIGIQKSFPKDQLSNYFSEQLDQQLSILSVPTNAEYIENRKTTLKALKNSGAYKAKRLLQSLPVRGQRTKSNARTQKDKRPSAVQQLRTAFRRKIRKGSFKKSKYSATVQALSHLKELNAGKNHMFTNRQI